MTSYRKLRENNDQRIYLIRQEFNAEVDSGCFVYQRPIQAQEIEMQSAEQIFKSSMQKLKESEFHQASAIAAAKISGAPFNEKKTKRVPIDTSRNTVYGFLKVGLKNLFMAVEPITRF